MLIAYLLNFIRGWFVIEGDARDTAAFLNLCMRGCYPYWRFDQDHDRFRFAVRRGVWRELEPACRQKKIDLSVCDEFGLPRIWRRYRKRYGLFLGLLCAISLVWISGKFVWRLEVSGTDRYYPHDVQTELEAHGFGVGSYIPSVDVNVLQNQILCDSSRFAWISINIVGTTAQIEVVEHAERQTKPRESAPANLIAAADGQIARLELRSGWPSVEVGEVVRAGQVLVSGISEDVDNRMHCAHADGRVYAQVMHRISVDVPFHYTAKRYVEEKICKKSIIFFGKEIKLFTNTGILGGSCDTINNERILSFFGRISIPVSLLTTTCLSYVTEPAVRDESAALALAQYRLRREIDALTRDRELIHRSVQMSVDEDSLSLDCTLWCLEDIAVSQPIALQNPVVVSQS